jgi:hypothetical protein
MNLLYVAVDPSLYTHYSAGHAMYLFPDKINEVPNFTACTKDNKCPAAKITHPILLKM